MSELKRGKAVKSFPTYKPSGKTATYTAKLDANKEKEVKDKHTSKDTKEVAAVEVKAVEEASKEGKPKRKTRKRKPTKDKK